MSTDEQQALEVARALISAGVPVFAARPALIDGQWDPTGGTGNTGYWLPTAWQSTVPTTSWLDPTVQGFEGKAWRPGWALCAVMGHVVDLLDVDPRHGGDATRAHLLEAGLWPRTYGAALTPSGGSHDFIAPLGLASLDAVREGLDYKGGKSDGKGRGFAFIAPTVRLSKTTGELAFYRWTALPDLDALAEGDDSGEGIAGLINGAGSRSGAPTADPFAERTPTPRRGVIPSGERHTVLHGYASSLRARNIDKGEAEVLMTARWAEAEQPAGNTYPLEAALAQIEDAWKRYEPGTSGRDDWSALVDPTPTGEASPVEQPGALDSEAVLVDTRYPVLDWREVFTSARSEAEWLCDPLLEVGRVVAVYSPPKVGKSLLALEIAAALALGRPVMGNAARDPLVVLYVDLENTTDDVHERLVDLGYGLDDVERLQARLPYLSFPDLPALDSEKGGTHLLRIARRHRADLVVIDTVSRVIEGDEDSGDTFRALYRHAVMPLKREGRTVLRLDHAGKDITKGQRGSSAKNDDVDAVWVLTKRTDTRLDLRRTHSRTNHGVDLVELTRQSGPLRHTIASSGAGSEVLEVAGHLDRLDVPLDAGRTVARKALAEAGIKVSNAVLEKAVRHRKDTPKPARGRSESASGSEGLEPARTTAPEQPETRSETCPGQVAGRSGSPAPVHDDDLPVLPRPIGTGRSPDPHLEDLTSTTATTRAAS